MVSEAWKHTEEHFLHHWNKREMKKLIILQQKFNQNSLEDIVRMHCHVKVW